MRRKAFLVALVTCLLLSSCASSGSPPRSPTARLGNAQTSAPPPTRTPATSQPQPVASGGAGWQEAFRDDFGQDRGWTRRDDEYFRFWLEAGRLQLLAKQPGYVGFSLLAGKTYSDVAVEVDAVVEASPEGGRIGLTLRHTDQGYYQLEASTQGAVSAFKFVRSENKIYTLKSDTTQAVRSAVRASNRLRAEARGSTLRLYANGTLVLEVSDSSFVQGQVGLGFGTLAGGPGMQVSFDNLVIQIPASPPAQAMAPMT